MTEQKLPERGCVFKHSTRCPVSSNAAEEVETYDWTVPIFWVNVIEERPMSNWVSSETGVPHQSPQLIFFENGKVTKVLSHADINSGNFGDFDEK